MTKIKKITLILIFLLLTLNPSAAFRDERDHTHPVEMPNLPAGSVPTIAGNHRLSFTPNYPILFVGDSRTVGMQQSVTSYGCYLNNQTFLAEIGKGYHWLSRQTALTDIPPSIIIINLEVNDLGNLYRYQALYETYAKTCWAGCPIYIVSVNPCSSPCTSVSNQQIAAFNTAMQEWIKAYNQENASSNGETFPIRYIDSYQMLMTEGFSSADGLHYSASTYLRIYTYILDQIEEENGDGNGTYTYTESR